MTELRVVIWISSSDINATYFPVSDFIMTVAFSVKPYKLR